MLVLAGIELIFFIVASTGQCFGFVLKTALITVSVAAEQCLQRVKAFSPTAPWLPKELG